MITKKSSNRSAADCETEIVLRDRLLAGGASRDEINRWLEKYGPADLAKLHGLTPAKLGLAPRVR